MAIESLLYSLKQVVDEQTRLREENEGSYPSPFENTREKVSSRNNIASSKPMLSNKVEELREVLTLLREKIGIVEHSIDLKDAHIR